MSLILEGRVVYARYEPRTPRQRARDRAWRFRFETLEAISQCDGSQFNAIVEASGHNHQTIRYGISFLRENGFVAKVGNKHLALYFITERGKIALAIWRGRQHRARQQNGTIIRTA